MLITYYVPTYTPFRHVPAGRRMLEASTLPPTPALASRARFAASSIPISCARSLAGETPTTGSRAAAFLTTLSFLSTAFAGAFGITEDVCVTVAVFPVVPDNLARPCCGKALATGCRGALPAACANEVKDFFLMTSGFVSRIGQRGRAAIDVCGRDVPGGDASDAARKVFSDEAGRAVLRAAVARVDEGIARAVFSDAVG